MTLSMRLRNVTSFCVGLLFSYYDVYRWVPLGRWNGQLHWPVVNDQFYPNIVIGSLLLWFLWSIARTKRFGVLIGAVMLTLWVVVHSLDWWIPYARSLPGNAARYSLYQSRTQVLPVIGHHYPPDGGHAVLDVILFPTCLLVVASAFEQRRDRRV